MAMGEVACVRGDGDAGDRAAPVATCAATTVLELLEQRVAMHPELESVRSGGEAVTYEELWERAGRLAAKLLEIGAGRGRAVGLFAERSVDLVVALLGLLRAGSVCVVLDAAQPDERLLRMCHDAQVGVVVGHETLMQRLGVFGRKDSVGQIVVGIRDGSDAPGAPRADGGLPAVHGGDSCYIAYTSGSTGEPKGVVYEHEGLANFVAWQVQDSACGVGDRTLQLAPMSFDVAFEEILATLAAGGTLVCCSEEERFDPELLFELIARERVARIFVTFVMLQSLAFVAPALTSPLPDSLREVVVGGERLRCDDSIRRMFASALPGCALVNQWGSVEVLIATSHTLDADPASWPLFPPVGRPVSGMHVHVWDERGSELPAGEIGELVVAGRGVARGYLGKAEATARAFVRDPCDPSVRAYRTGDLGRVDARGDVECLGRIDDQVKVRGHRVELGEVEHALSRIPGVGQSLVYLTGGDAFDRSLHAAVVLTAPGLTVAELRTGLESMLPSYMIPSRFEMVPSLPRTPSGKLDRRAFEGTLAEEAAGR